MFFREPFKIKNIIFVLLMIFLIWFIVQIKEIALLFFGAYVIACSLNPLVDKLSKYMNRAVASTLVLTGVLTTIILILIPIFTISYEEIQKLIIDLPSRIDKLIIYISDLKVFGFHAIDLINIDTVIQNTSQIATEVVNKSINITVAIMEAITVALSVGMIVFYLTYEKNSINHSTLKLFPPRIRKKAQEIMKTIEEKVGGYVVAQGLSMTTVAIFTAIGLGLLKVEYSMLLGVIAGILDIIPIVGPTVALVLGIIAASAKGWIWTLPTIGIYLAAQWISNNFVRPVVFGRFLDLHPVLVIFSFLVAAKFLGVWGVILAPAIAALIATLFDELYIKVINKTSKEDNV